jgi:hypothetical protein
MKEAERAKRICAYFTIADIDADDEHGRWQWASCNKAMRPM